jgi:hypothetical protein
MIPPQRPFRDTTVRAEIYDAKMKALNGETMVPREVDFVATDYCLPFIN